MDDGGGDGGDERIAPQQLLDHGDPWIRELVLVLQDQTVCMRCILSPTSPSRRQLDGGDIMMPLLVVLDYHFSVKNV